MSSLPARTISPKFHLTTCTSLCADFTHIENSCFQTIKLCDDHSVIYLNDKQPHNRYYFTQHCLISFWNIRLNMWSSFAISWRARKPLCMRFNSFLHWNAFKLTYIETTVNQRLILILLVNSHVRHFVRRFSHFPWMYNFMNILLVQLVKSRMCARRARLYNTRTFTSVRISKGTSIVNHFG